MSTVSDDQPGADGLDFQTVDAQIVEGVGFGGSQVLTSNNGGEAWHDLGTGQPDLTDNAVIVDPLYPNHVYVGTDLGVYASTNGGNTWQDFNAGVSDALLVFDLSISSSNRKLRAVTHGNGVYERALLPEAASEVESPETPVLDFALEQNYPNPFNPDTRMAFTLPFEGRVTLTVFDMNGRVVAELMRNQRRAAGGHEVSFTAQNLASGIYSYRLEVAPLNGSLPALVEVKRMTYLK